MTNEQFNALVALIDAKLNTEHAMAVQDRWLFDIRAKEREIEAQARLLLVNGTSDEAQALLGKMAARTLK